MDLVLYTPPPRKCNPLHAAEALPQIEKPQFGELGLFIGCLLHPEGMEHGHSDPFSSRKLEREPGGERLHTVTLDIVAVPYRKRDGHGHSRLELHVVRIARFHRALHDYA